MRRPALCGPPPERLAPHCSSRIPAVHASRSISVDRVAAERDKLVAPMPGPNSTEGAGPSPDRPPGWRFGEAGCTAHAKRGHGGIKRAEGSLGRHPAVCRCPLLRTAGTGSNLRFAMLCPNGGSRSCSGILALADGTEAVAGAGACRESTLLPSAAACRKVEGLTERFQETRASRNGPERPAALEGARAGGDAGRT